MGVVTPVMRLVVAVLAVLAPTALALAILVLTDQIELAPATVALIAAVIGPTVMAAVWYADFRSVTAYIVRLADASDGHAGGLPQLNSGVARTLIAAVERLDARHRVNAARAGHRIDLLESVLGAIPDPVLVLDAERRVVQVNEAADELIGDQALAKDLSLAFRNPDLLGMVDMVLAGASQGSVIEFSLAAHGERQYAARVVGCAAPEPPPILDGVTADRGLAPIAALVVLYDITVTRRTEQMRDDFVANVSHELRTPLASLIGFIETVRGPARDDPAAQDHFLGIMHDQATRMAHLVTELLTLSRIEMLEHSPPTGEVAVDRLVEAVVGEMSIQATQRGMDIHVESQAGLPPVRGDRDQLTRVLENLIDNAIKYGRPGSPIVITCSEQPTAEGPGEVVISVNDQGPGVAREHVPRLTERFYRVDASRSRPAGGAGLGLAIVKHILNRHMGRLAIDTTPGRGSTFQVILPKKSRPT